MHLVERTDGVEVVLGVGLVGGAVLRALEQSPTFRRGRAFPTTWNNPTTLEAELSTVEGALAESAGRLRLFWCAGRGGFASSETDLAPELENFRRVLEWADRAAAHRRVEFHLTSSAGGLHEGQRRVADPAPASQLRPYGRLKLEQERLLETCPRLVRYVYRPSSVYGIPRGRSRLGMIPTLIRNALARRPSTISAHPSTLRDYVSAQDIGHYMASEGRPPGTHYLVMGFPLSVFSLVSIVERALQRQVAVVYTTTRSNDQHITFAPQLRPAGWSPRALESQVSLLVAAILQRQR